MRFTGVYVFYTVSHEVWWDLRFILPATPALILAALLGLDALLRRVRLRVIAPVGLSLWAIGLGWFWSGKFNLLFTKTSEQSYANASAAARTRFPPNALVLAGLHSGPLYFYTNFAVIRWEFVNATEFGRYRTLAEAAGRPICAVLHEVEERDALQEKCPGAWTKLAVLNNVSLWQLPPLRPVPDPK